jgi:hypothetical protein
MLPPGSRDAPAVLPLGVVLPAVDYSVENRRRLVVQLLSTCLYTFQRDLERTLKMHLGTFLRDRLPTKRGKESATAPGDTLIRHETGCSERTSL